ncbi:SDR family oxidoreductase [Vibrio cholerae]|uniref:oxidoreductase n=1 Tax=Vibrio cholerae TaxID=666 RepID=UPI00115B2881|nr:oxidoreductase [Vibrio cholerae]EGR3966291.1 SDR family oxidoreductase [Vibrio cholerae]ELJ8614994.1 SDR family oxidoreductase [Vibrio cholerae]ELJ8694714.1 SDR family oxidoreductase [Vibrio cholerae]MCD1196511.1 flagellin modification protein A [Vibrio cholerae]MCD1199639.1 flagellin modification protein A [Vibrio cholerae]
MEKLLENKTIVVAGAGGLLGTRLVPALLKQGAHVIAADIHLEVMRERLASLGVDLQDEKLSCYELDVTTEENVKAFFNHQVQHIDGAVNATYPRNKTYGKHFFDVSLESFNENLSLHLGSAFLFTQQSAAYFKRQQQPFSLVNISSIYGVVAPKFEIYNNTPMTMPVEYAAIKSAIQHLNKYVVSYVNDSRFRINCVSPGGIFDHQPDAFLQAYKEKTNGAGMLDVKEVTGSVLFLLSEQSRYVTGQNIVVDDGFSL